MRYHPRVLPVLLLGMCVAGPTSLTAKTMTDSFQVRISIQGTCTVLTTTDIDFGTQVSTAGSYDQTGSIRVQCTKDLPFTLGLDGGTTTSDVAARAMANAGGTAQIPYTLSSESATGAVWGNDSTNWYSGLGMGLGAAYEIALTVYARATLTGSEPVGAYTDTVTATLTY